MPLDRRQMLLSLAAGIATAPSTRLRSIVPKWLTSTAPALRHSNGAVDWRAVRELFPLAPDWTHLASFLFVSHPKPVAEAIDKFRRKLDADPVWIAARVPANTANGEYRAGGSVDVPKPARQSTVGASTRSGEPWAPMSSPNTARRPDAGTAPVTTAATPQACARAVDSAPLRPPPTRMRPC